LRFGDLKYKTFKIFFTKPSLTLAIWQLFKLGTYRSTTRYFAVMLIKFSKNKNIKHKLKNIKPLVHNLTQPNA
jgi:hypothetical protein